MKPFKEYMHDWLYAPDGYYANYKAIGKEGDFFTAVSASPFFGATIAHYMIHLIRKGWLSPQVSLVEIGAHQGFLLGDMIRWIAQEAPELLQTMRFGIVERFEPLKTAQKAYFAQAFGDTILLEHFDAPSCIKADEAFVVANEIFDAFACELLYQGKTAMVDEAHRIHWIGKDEEVLAIAERYGRIKGEVAIGYEAFAASLFGGAKKMVFVTFDYGEKEPREDFSIRLYKEHRVHPLFEEGLDLEAFYKASDITYDVHFAHLIDAFKAAGFSCQAYKTQLRALTEMGLTDLLEQLADMGDQALYLRELNKIKTLIDPQVMGERFKMVEFHKNIG